MPKSDLDNADLGQVVSALQRLHDAFAVSASVHQSGGLSANLPIDSKVNCTTPGWLENFTATVGTAPAVSQ
jgi:hypothetical protein